jgi:membrane protein DedA with SNARE-associated domain
VEEITKFITETIRDFGYLAIFVLMVLESACIPIPSEVTMLFGGALANAAFFEAQGVDRDPLNFLLVGLVGAMANLVGSWLAYWAGYAGGRPLIERWGRYIFLRAHEIDRAEAWFDDHGEAAVFVSRLLPVVRTFISLPAGVARMPFGKFTLYTFLGCLPWTFALAGAGYAVGEQWETVERYLRPISIVVAVALVGVLVWWLVRRSRQRRREEAPVE